MEEPLEEEPAFETKLEESEKLCMLCSEMYNPSTKENRKFGSLNTTIKFKKFCKELEVFLAERGIMQVRKKKRVQCRLRGDLNLAYGQLSICVSCLKLICGAMDVKCLAEKVEETVRDLQMQVLEGLETLDGHMEKFLGRMKRIEGVVKKSDGNKLREYLEGNVEEKLRGDVHQFRARVLDAVTDLKVYRKEITDKTVCLQLYERKEQHRLFQRRKNMTDQKVQTDIRGEVISAKNTSVQKKIKVKTKEQQTEPIVILENEETCPFTAVKVEVDPTDYPMEEESAVNFEDDLGHDDLPLEPEKNRNEVVVKETSPPRKRPRRSVTLKRKIQIPSSSSSSEENNDSEEEKKAGDSHLEDSPSSDEESDASNYSDVDSDVHKIPTPRKLLNLPPDTSKFKRNIISFVVRKLEQKGDKDVAQESLDLDDPRKRYYFDYNSTTDTLSLESIPIILHDSEKFLACTLCEYQARGHNSLQRMHGHILGRHLGAFQCSFCSAKLSNWRSYKEHVAGHKTSILCPICAKPFQNKESLKKHRWLHMNESEKADPVQRGMNNPFDLRKKIKERPKSCFCATCGKAFQTEKMVQVHEKIHGERDRVPCHLCGKLLMNTGASLQSHLKWSCPGTEKGDGEGLKRECPVCHGIFKNAQSLKNHQRSVHPKDPSRIQVFCQVCGKVFRSKTNFNDHMDIHGEEKKYKCGKCGVGFKQKRNRMRHEKGCGGGKGRNSGLKEELEGVVVAGPSGGKGSLEGQYHAGLFFG